MRIQGAIALVTGANRGIGLSLVSELLRRGAAKVYACARDVKELDRAIALDPHRVVALALDVTDAAQRARVAETATDVTLLVNNAGVADMGSVLEAPPDAFKRNFDVNCFGLLQVTRALTPALAANGGAVVNILTLVAMASMPRLGVYNASKAAAWSLTQSLRADLARRGVAVFAVFPGAVDTDMTRALDIPKTAPADVAASVADGVEAGTEDIFPDPMSQAFYAQWTADHKAVEHRFAAM